MHIVDRMFYGNISGIVLEIIRDLICYQIVKKEDTDSEAVTPQKQKTEFKLFNKQGKEVNPEALGFDLVQASKEAASIFKASPNTSANGNYSGFGSVWAIAVMNNNGGTHGQNSVSGLFNYNIAFFCLLPGLPHVRFKFPSILDYLPKQATLCIST